MTEPTNIYKGQGYEFDSSSIASSNDMEDCGQLRDKNWP